MQINNIFSVRMPLAKQFVTHLFYNHCKKDLDYNICAIMLMPNPKSRLCVTEIHRDGKVHK